MARPYHHRHLFFIFSGFLFLLLAALMLLTPEPVEAQCGASSSSCKNCHEVNAKHPVNGSGEWHVKHAFGDFCAFCHGGNVQAVQQDLAHKDMVYPLANPKASCQSCHPADTVAKAEVYAKALGVDLNAAAGGGSSGAMGGTGTSDPANIESKPIPPPGEHNASGALIDYNRRYDVEVLGIFDSSRTGNLILAGFAVFFFVLGTFVVWRFERFGEALRKASALPDDDWRTLLQNGTYQVNGPVIPTRPATQAGQAPSTVPAPVAAAPQIELPAEARKLDEGTQAALRSLLADPEHGPAIIRALSRLDSNLIDSLQNLNKQDRALLLAIVEQLGEKKP